MVECVTIRQRQRERRKKHEQAPIELAANSHLPDPLLCRSQVIDWNFELTEDNSLPYDVFETMRYDANIDLTALTWSSTRRGTLYRQYALTRGRAA